MFFELRVALEKKILYKKEKKNTYKLLGFFVLFFGKVFYKIQILINALEIRSTSEVWKCAAVCLLT